MSNPKQQLNTEIPQEHIKPVLNSLLCERLVDFERRLNPETNQWEWRGKMKDGEELPWSEKLFNFCDEMTLTLDLACTVAAANNVNMAVHFAPEQKLFICQFLEVLPDKKVHVKVNVTSSHGALGLALAIAGLLKFDIQAHHKVLFPGHYLSVH